MLRGLRKDLHHVAGAKSVSQRHDLAVDLGAGATVAHIGVHGVGKIERRGAVGKLFHLALGGEHENISGIKIEFHALQELAWIGKRLMRIEEAREPLHLALVGNVGAAFLVFPVRGDPALGDLVHLEGADLRFHPLAVRADHGRVQ